MRTRKSEWTVRVRHPNGNWAEPEVVGRPTRNPKVNGLPSIRIPIREDDKWNDDVWEEQEMEVYYKGERQPIEQFERLERTEGTTAIAGRGGIELRNIVDTEYTEEETTTVADEVITNNSTYTANVDEVTGGAEENVQIDSATTTAEFTSRTSTIQADDPIVVDNDRVRLAQTAFVNGDDTRFIRSDSGYTNGEASNIFVGEESHSLTFSPDYDIPGANAEIYLRSQNFPDAGSDLIYSVEMNNTQINDGIAPLGGAIEWENLGTVENEFATLNAGSTYTIEVIGDRTTDGGSPEASVDVIALVDNRFNYTFDNTLNEPSGNLDGPELYPESFDVEFDAVSPARAVAGGRVESTFDSVASNQQVGLSNDGGTSYNTANNTDTFETDFTSAGTSLRFRARLSRYGSRTGTTPLTGHLGQEIQDYTLSADLQTLPFVINTTLNDRLVDVLNNIAGTGNFVWEFDIDNDGNKTIDFTTNRQREVVTSLPLSNFTVNKELSNIVEKVIVFGGTNNVARDRINANHGTAVALEEDYLKEGSESVNDADTDATFIRGDDYTINYRTGEITTLSGGNITNGEALDISYDWKIRSTATKTGATDPRTEVIEVPELTTQELANNIASRLLNELSVLEETVDLTIPATVTDFSAIDALRVNELPTDETFQIKSIEGTPETIQVTAGNRESLQDLTEQITSQLRTVSRKA